MLRDNVEVTELDDEFLCHGLHHFICHASLVYTEMQLPISPMKKEASLHIALVILIRIYLHWSALYSLDKYYFMKCNIFLRHLN
jgi:hypothetical protein